MHISSSYAKILGEKLFRTWEIPRSGSKAKDGEKKKKRRERLNGGDNNGQATHGVRKHAWRTQATWANIDWNSELEIGIGIEVLKSSVKVHAFHRRMLFTEG